MNNFNKIFDKSIPIFFNLVIFIYLLGGIITPIFKNLGFEALSDTLYWIYHFFCHQKPERTFFILGEQMAFCSRDFGIFSAMQIVGIYSLFLPNKIGKLKIHWYLLLITPMILDGSIQMIAEILANLYHNNPFYVSTNITRLITGSMFGAAMSNYLFSTLKEELHNDKSQ